MVQPSLSRSRLFLRLAVLVLASMIGFGPAHAETAASSETGIRFVQIATGPTAGTYFPVGGLIANAISNPPGSRPCERGGSCGVPGLIAVAQSTNGSMANLASLAAGTVDLGMSQADLAYWAYHGTGVYKGKEPQSKLRGIAMLYSESIHLVARKDARISSVADLKGKRVSVGEEGSGTLVDAMLVLEAYGLRKTDIKPEYTRPSSAAEALIQGRIDAFFFVAGAPVSAVTALTNEGLATLVPLSGPPAHALAQQYPFLLVSTIPADTYEGVPETPTLSVGALLVCSADAPDELIYGITAAIFHPNTRPLFAKGHPAASKIALETASTGLGIPLHAGAARYYDGQKGASATNPTQ